MMANAEPDLTDHLLRWVLAHVDLEPERRSALDADTNLIETGLLDSVAFLDLITYLEEKTGHEVDLTEVDPADLISIAGLCRHVSTLGDRS